MVFVFRCHRLEFQFFPITCTRFNLLSTQNIQSRHDNAKASEKHNCPATPRDGSARTSIVPDSLARNPPKEAHRAAWWISSAVFLSHLAAGDFRPVADRTSRDAHSPAVGCWADTRRTPAESGTRTARGDRQSSRRRGRPRRARPPRPARSRAEAACRDGRKGTGAASGAAPRGPPPQAPHGSWDWSQEKVGWAFPDHCPCRREHGPAAPAAARWTWDTGSRSSSGGARRLSRAWATPGWSRSTSGPPAAASLGPTPRPTPNGALGRAPGQLADFRQLGASGRKPRTRCCRSCRRCPPVTPMAPSRRS